MTLVAKREWTPVGVKGLEANAWEALKATKSTCITAGPGAGKTEFLAQRATYLLQTGMCASPRRILAISFKRDAARNLQERVIQRCPPEQARRFSSLTYDAFAKSLLDRFINLIPRSWRPQPDYVLKALETKEIVSLLRDAQHKIPPEWKTWLVERPERTFESHWLGRQQLQENPDDNHPADEWLLQYWWRVLGATRKGGQLTYAMVNRLAEFILRTHPNVCEALRLTYPYVFLDEFQDTTYGQYGLVTTAFLGSKCTLTAVGDDKQRIMVWAGALPNAFKRFRNDFEAFPISLLCNYRSRPELVAIQHVVAQALETGSPEAESRALANVTGTFAGIWNFSNQKSESAHLAQWIATDAQDNGLRPRDYCILVRQKADDFENQLRPHFEAASLGLRNESRLIEEIPLQDLLCEDVTQIVVSILTVAIKRQAPEALNFSYEAICDLNGIDKSNTRAVKQTRKLVDALFKELQHQLKAEPSGVEAKRLTQVVINFLDLDKLRRSSPRYALGDSLDRVVAALLSYFGDSVEGASSWEEWLEQIMGDRHIPLMTVHKSKGLEFHTVIFVGLDDKQWWSHKSGDHESLATFFVALSRAKQRVFFTYCRNRATTNVSDLYDLLSEAGITEESFD